MECQVEKLEHFRHILLFEFNRGAKAAKAARNICAVYGNNAIGESTARKCFSRSKEDRFEMSDTLRSGRPLGFDKNRLNILIHNDLRQCSRTGKCDELCSFHHRATFTFNVQGSKIRCMGAYALSHGCANHATEGETLQSPIHCCDVTNPPSLFSGEQ